MDARYVVLKVTDYETGDETVAVVCEERSSADNVARARAIDRARRLAYESRDAYLVARVVSKVFSRVEVEQEDVTNDEPAPTRGAP